MICTDSPGYTDFPCCRLAYCLDLTPVICQDEYKGGMLSFLKVVAMISPPLLRTIVGCCELL